jgi:hypothetical protein
MDLIERYVHAVTKHLPANQRLDVANELRATIEDMATDHAKGSEPKAADIKAALTKLGDPAILANRYGSSKQYLVGPRWYGVYITTLVTILSIVVPIMAIITGITTIGQNDQAISASIVDAVMGALSVGASIFFWVTIIFALMERLGVDPSEAGTASKKAAWKPEDLPAVPANRTIPRAEAATGIIMNAAVIIMLAFSSSLFRSNGDDGSMPILHPGLWDMWIPLFIGLSVLGVALEAWKYLRGMWSVSMVAASIAISVAWIAGFLALIATHDLVNPAFVELMTTNAGSNVQTIINWTVRIGGAVAIGSHIWGIFDVIRRYNRQRV